MDPGLTGEGETLVNALIREVAAFVLGFLRFSPALGGAIAGYLEGGSRNDGVRVGALAGVVAAGPILILVALFLLVTAAAIPAGDPGAGSASSHCSWSWWSASSSARCTPWGWGRSAAGSATT